ncbi:hypothetical protein GSI_03398 [Ganoderma sinense ZZ0214-1]|uniref:Transporter n=1 Tax=Ganoderma sinense ZZ0214-1 TaxID=1077348 RepID=A0A2G8SLJ1_9APHY|nr:hypothetical protein GSI_03398 [Ganoderma sinense ZZ0214-1]
MASPSNATGPDQAAQPDTRPPGGTRRSGTKTPRRVQWMSDERNPSPSPRALDEHGLDPAAFETLTHALERHRSTSTSAEGERPTNPLSSRVMTAVSPGPSLPSSPSPEITPIREVPGEAFIEKSETAGLPGRDIEEYSHAQAQKLITAHKYNLFKFRGKHRHRRSGSEALSDADHEGKKPRRGLFKGRDAWSDIEKSAETRTETKASEPKGILSTLLSFYEPASVLQSGMSTPARSEMSFDESRAASIYNAQSSPTLPPPASVRGEGYFPPQANANGSVLSLRPPNHPWTRVPFSNSRPPKSRGGAGVFGPLIAGTNNITGVAAPMSATVAPDLKRPGYHLSRYSLDESKLPKAGSAVERKPLTRSRSMHFDSQSLRSPLMTGPPTPASEETLSPHSSSGGSQSPVAPLAGKQGWNGVLKDLPKFAGRTPSTVPSTPATELGAEDGASSFDEKREKRRKRRKAEIWITRHVAEIVCRQEFILKLARAMMMFGGPTHRLQAQIKATAKVLDIELSCMYLPDVMLVSFDDAGTGTSNIKFIRQGSALDIGKLQEAHELYWEVIHDNVSVKDASVHLDDLMRRKQFYKNWQIVLFGGACSASICSVSFNGSFIDCLVSFPLGCLLILIQFFAARNELYSNVFEITVATVFSFIAAALSATPYFCYSAVASSSVVLILPGFIVLCGSLELSSRNIVSGAVRVCFACIYSLFLGFGLAIGATAFSKLTNHSLAGSNDLTCGLSHDPHGPWWQRTPSLWWAFLTVPLYSLFLSLRNHAPWNRRELYLLIAISCIGWVTNHFTGTRFHNQSDISAAVGALAVGFVANIYGRFFNGSAFVVMITGILFQLPSGLANGGLFTFVQQQESGSSTNESYLSGFQTALQLISVCIGLTVGLGISLVLVHPIPSRRRAAGLFTL